MNGNNNGFTLVEMAVVLVIIGIIAGMGIKVKALIDVVVLRSELAKMQRVDTGITIYLAKKGGNLSDAASSGQLNLQPAIDAGIISPRDLISDLTVDWRTNTTKQSSSNLGFKEIFRCGLRLANNNIDYYFVQYMPASSTSKNLVADDICIRFYPTQRLACGIETIIDDQDSAKGDARFFINVTTISGISPSIVTELRNTFADCTSLARKGGMYDQSTSFSVYGKRLDYVF